MSKKLSNSSQPSIPIFLVKKSEWKEWQKKQPLTAQTWLNKTAFNAVVGSHTLITDSSGISRVLIVTPDKPDLWALAALPTVLPTGEYHLEYKTDSRTADALMLGWLLGSYRFDRYKKNVQTPAVLKVPIECDMQTVQRLADSINLARDLVNTPANDMGPAELAAACKKVAVECKAKYSEIVGEALIKENYPAIYTVGQASSRPPRLIDITWGNKKHPLITLVGKGVCFDSGGLDIKPSSGMKLMKKDMGGAASLLALARMIMLTALPVRLRLLVPAVENSISGNAYRPFDIINTRKGLTVEVGNTDAEGRLILGDALFEADQEEPELLIDCATLTGAARTALGTDIPAFFTHDDALASNLAQYSLSQNDPMWRLPLWKGYREMLNSPIADINSAPDGPYAGAITAALYLNEFVKPTTSWVHIDMMAWNNSSRPGRPAGGEAMAVRALFAYIRERFTEEI